MTALFSLALLMQVGTDIHTYPQADLPIITQRRRDQAVDSTQDTTDPLGECLHRVRDDAGAGQAYARNWLAHATTLESRVGPDQCLGQAMAQQGDFSGAEAAFADGVAAVPGKRTASAVPLMAMAGNAALAAGNANGALDWFTRAFAIREFEDQPARGAIAADRARALVALGRNDEAAAALTDARRLAPADPTVFLLSATLARRAKDLAAAQGFIETAAGLDRLDPAIGLEAGVIAVLSGHDEAARRSWQSVIATAPDGAEAQTARGYLAQLGPETKPLDHSPAPPTSGPRP
jgi:tetratricopeptide (TPR) repeat protein